MSPSAHALPAEYGVAALRECAGVVPPWLGLGTCVQAVPSQCSTRVWSVVPSSAKPAAEAFAVEVAPTAASWLLDPGLGLGTCVQELPFQCRIKVWSSRPVKPTAQASWAEVAATPV